MSYQFRVLPIEEYEKLGLPAAQLPVGGIVCVVEWNGTIVGRWMAGTTTILEGLMIDPGHQKNPAVAGRLFYGMMDELRRQKVPAVLTIVESDQVAELAEHAEFQYVPGKIYQKDMR